MDWLQIMLFWSACKSKQEVYEKNDKMSKNIDYTTGNSLDYLYHQTCYKLFDMCLSRQANTVIPQQINFTRTFEQDDGVIMFLWLKSSKELF